VSGRITPTLPPEAEDELDPLLTALLIALEAAETADDAALDTAPVLPPPLELQLLRAKAVAMPKAAIVTVDLCIRQVPFVEEGRPAGCGP